jgi:hypothetical protein
VTQLAAKKKRRGAAPRGKPKAHAGKRTKARTKPKVQPASGGAGEAHLPPVLPSQPNPLHWDNSSMFEAAAQIAAWRQARNTAAVSTGGAVEPVPVPLSSFPPVTPQPDHLAGTAGPQLDLVSPIPDVAGLDHDEAVEVIKEWFLSNFEDPAQSTPRNDGEFQYIWGGPYDARDEIGDAFSGNAPEEVIEDAITAVEAEGIDWAPHGNRGKPDYDEEADVGASDPNALHAEMIEQIEALERAMTDLRKQQRHGIGHNNPPGPIEPAPLSDKDLDEIEEALAVLKKQPSVPILPGTEARTAVALLMKLGDRLRPLARATGAYLAQQADNFVTEAVKEAGKEAGKRIIQSPLWLPIIYKLPALADAAHQWLQSLGSHL